MQDLIGKKYQYKLIPDQVKTITGINGDAVVFDDGGRVPLNRLDELFTLIGATQSPEEARRFLTQTMDDKMDPQNFFNSTHNDLLEKLKKEAEKIDTTNLPLPKIATNTAIDNNNTVPEGPVRKIVVETDDRGKVTSREENAAVTQTPNDFFKKMKRNTQVEISIKWVENIPNLDLIKMMDDNFDQGVLEYLVEDITDKIIASPNIVSNQIREQLNKMMKGQTAVKVKKPKKEKNAKADNSKQSTEISS